MNGIHDMGGMHGFGPVVREEHEPVFHAPWEGRVFGMLRQLNVAFPARQPGAARDIIEHIEPARYLSLSYYERFLEVLTQRALTEGLITSAELEARTALFENGPAATVASRSDSTAAAQALSGLSQQLRPPPGGSRPRFALGDAVFARNLNWPGHNRLPRYIRGKRGVVERVNACHRIEDANAAALGPDPQTVYTVRFDGAEVWGPECESNISVYLELWECYLEPAATK